MTALRGFAAGLFGVVIGGCTFAHAAAPDNGNFLSRLTVAVPVFTRHFPDGRDFNDDNWGGFVFLALSDRLSLVGGDFLNSYDRNTALGGISYLPIDIDLSPLRVAMGGIVALDINRGYRGYNSLDPVLAAASIKLSAHDTGSEFFDRTGLLVTIIPGVADNTSTAVNLALMLRL